MKFTAILICLVVILIFFLVFRSYKKREFDSIKIGDEIFYPHNSFCDECYEFLETDIVTSVEHYDDHEGVKCIHTEKGETYYFLDYIRDNFILAR